MSNQLKTLEIYLEPADNKRLSSLCGPFDENIKQIERHLAVEIIHRDNFFKVTGKLHNCAGAVEILKNLYVDTQPVRGVLGEIEPEAVHLAIPNQKP